MIQLLKLKQNAQQLTAALLVKILNEDLLQSASYSIAQLFNTILDLCSSESVYPSDKEKYILTSLPTAFLVKSALLAYQLREGFGFLNAVLAFSLETAQVPLDFFNEYTLT